jgi:dihydroorotase
VHELLGYEDPPPLYGRYETIRTLDRLEEVYEEERKLKDLNRYESKIVRVLFYVTDPQRRLVSWLKKKWAARKEKKAAERQSRLASDATELEILPQHHNRRAEEQCTVAT